MTDDDKTYSTVPTSQKDLEARLENNFASTATGTGTTDPNEVNAPYATEETDTSAYIGVSPEYMTHASDTEMPYRAEEGPEAEALDLLTSGMAVAPPPEPKESTETAGGGSLQESVYTATSGEDFSSQVADKPKETEADPSQTTVTKAEAPTGSPTPSAASQSTGATQVGGSQSSGGTSDTSSS